MRERTCRGRIGSWAGLVGIAAILAVPFMPAPAGAAVTAFLNFDSSGSDSFLTALNSAADTAGLGTGYFTVSEATSIAGLIKSKMEGHFTGFDVSFVLTPALGATPITFAETGGGFGSATYDRRAAFLVPDTRMANVFTPNFPRRSPQARAKPSTSSGSPPDCRVPARTSWPTRSDWIITMPMAFPPSPLRFIPTRWDFKTRSSWRPDRRA